MDDIPQNLIYHLIHFTTIIEIRVSLDRCPLTPSAFAWNGAIVLPRHRHPKGAYGTGDLQNLPNQVEPCPCRLVDRQWFQQWFEDQGDFREEFSSPREKQWRSPNEFVALPTLYQERRKIKKRWDDGWANNQKEKTLENPPSWVLQQLTWS